MGDERGKTAADVIPGFAGFLDGLAAHLESADPAAFAVLVAEAQKRRGDQSTTPDPTHE